MGDYNPSENSYDPIMGKSVVENGDLLTAGVKYVPRGEKGGRLLPIFSSSVTSSRTALLLSLLSLLTALVLLALGLASLAPLPSKVAEQHKVLELLQGEIEEQEEKLNQLEAREEEERAERVGETKGRGGVLGRVGRPEPGLQERLPGSTCHLPPDPGTCTTASLQRWHYNPATSACHQFTYGGCDGNKNNFRTARDCLAACGGTADCLAPPDAGPCDGRSTRYYWDPVQEVCETFEYGGCAGNTNNFLSLDQCNDNCQDLEGRNIGKPGSGVSMEEEPLEAANHCSLPPARGPCKGNFIRWFSSPDDSSCKQFTWGGCEGNANNFATKAKCLSRCGRDKPVVKNNSRAKELCSLPLDRGSCSGDFVRWGGSGEGGGCRAFLWGGCGGNQNNFPSQEECLRECPD